MKPRDQLCASLGKCLILQSSFTSLSSGLSTFYPQDHLPLHPQDHQHSCSGSPTSPSSKLPISILRITNLHPQDHQPSSWGSPTSPSSGQFPHIDRDSLSPEPQGLVHHSISSLTSPSVHFRIFSHLPDVLIVNVWPFSFQCQHAPKGSEESRWAFRCPDRPTGPKQTWSILPASKTVPQACEDKGTWEYKSAFVKYALGKEEEGSFHKEHPLELPELSGNAFLRGSGGKKSRRDAHSHPARDCH